MSDDNLPDDYWSYVDNPAHPDYEGYECELCGCTDHHLDDCPNNEEEEDES